MKKIFSIVFICCFLFASFYTCMYLIKIYHSSATLWQTSEIKEPDYHLVLIAPEAGSAYWDEVYEAAKEEAEIFNVSLDYWGAYRSNPEEIINYMDMAIAAKIDGIIVMGMDLPQFVPAIDKATKNGIPVITVSVDAPTSLRKAYVGTDHFVSGILLGNEIVEVLQQKGKIGLVNESANMSYQQLRINGLEKVFKQYPNIEVVELYPSEEITDSIQGTNHLLNHHPDIDAFIGMSAEDTLGIIKAINSRTQIEQYRIFSFEETQEMVSFLKAGTISAILQQSPKEMGKQSVDLMIQWLEGHALPLKSENYTPITIKNRLGGDYENHSK